MGYYTHHDLEVDDCEIEMEAIAKTIGEVTNDVDDRWWQAAITGEESCKWYSCHEDMAKVSAEYPGVLFTMRGEGEETGDQWIAYYRDGKHYVDQRPEWEPAPFDESKLDTKIYLH